MCKEMSCKLLYERSLFVGWGPHLLQDLRMPGSHVDVNLHPTKQEVGFLYQDQLLETIREAVEELLLTSNDK